MESIANQIGKVLICKPNNVIFSQNILDRSYIHIPIQ